MERHVDEIRRVYKKEPDGVGRQISLVEATERARSHLDLANRERTELLKEITAWDMWDDPVVQECPDLLKERPDTFD